MKKRHQIYFCNYVSDLNIPSDFVDQSYQHDVAPSFYYKDLIVFINHFDKSQRTDDTNNCLRFCIMLDSDYHLDTEYNFNIMTDSFDEVKKIMYSQI